MLFALLCTDKPDSVDLRMRVRPDHLKYLESLGPALKAAGPFTTDEGSPTGTLAIIEAADRNAAQTVADADPYAKAGLFASVEIRPWKWVVKNPEAQ
jgi:uncharacterized protein YciI